MTDMHRTFDVSTMLENPDDTSIADAYGKKSNPVGLVRRALNPKHRTGPGADAIDDQRTSTEAPPDDPINPSHYRKHPSGIECIDITRHMNFNLGNTIKYIWRAGEKNDLIEDLRKAAWYLDDEIRRLEAK